MPAAVSAGGLAQGHVRPDPSYRISDHVFNNFESRGHGRIATAPSSSPATPCSIASRTRRGSTRVASPRGGGSTPSPWRSFGLGRATEWTSRKRSEQSRIAPWKRSTRRRRRRRPARGPGPAIRSWPGQTGEGRLPDPPREENCAAASYRAGDAVNLSIGQGDLASPRCRWPWSSRPSPMGCSGSHRWLPVPFWHRGGHEIPLIASAASPWQGRSRLRSPRARRRDATGWLSQVGLRRLPPGSVRRGQDGHG